MKEIEIAFYLGEGQRKAIHRLFEKSEDPGWVIVSESPSDEAGNAEVVFYFRNSVVLWYFVIAANNELPFGDRADDFIKQLKADPKSLFNKDNLLDGLI